MRLRPALVAVAQVFVFLLISVVGAEPRRDPAIVSVSQSSTVYLDGQWAASGVTRDVTGACTPPRLPAHLLCGHCSHVIDAIDVRHQRPSRCCSLVATVRVPLVGAPFERPIVQCVQD